MMPPSDRIPPEVLTVHLGQFTRRHAAMIAEQLDTRHIVWWVKQPGSLSRIWERGVRLFVDRARLDEAQRIADRVLGEESPA